MKHHESQSPLLAKIVKVVFLVPAASSLSERVFSVAGNVVTPKRAKLNPEKVEDLGGELQHFFLSAWIHFLYLYYQRISCQDD